jgi:uncharacterized SAM-dependent methyltransferase
MLADYFEHWPTTSPNRRQVAMLLGSNLGNLEEGSAVALLQRIRERLRGSDVLLLGLDLMKDPHVIQAAYDDPQGVTAQFNLNLLRRLNRELGMNFDLEAFSLRQLLQALHAASWSAACSKWSPPVLDREFEFAAGETLYTEQSQKYSPRSIERLARLSGFDSTQLLTDERRGYALAVWRCPADPQ